MKAFIWWILFFVCVITCCANSLKSLIAEEGVIEEIKYFPASVEAVEHAGRLFNRRIVEELKGAMFGQPIKEKCDALECFEEIISMNADFTMTLWGMDKKSFKKIYNEYEAAELFFFSAAIPWNEDWMGVTYIEGVGVNKNGKMHVVHILDTVHKEPSFIEFSQQQQGNLSVSERNKNVADNDKKWIELSSALFKTKSGQPEKKNASDVALNEKWNNYVENLKRQKTIMTNELENDQVTELLSKDKAIIHSYGTFSMHFIAEIYDNLQWRFNLHNQIMQKPLSQNNDNIDALLMRMEATPETTARISTLQWETLCRLSKDKANKLFCYTRSVEMKKRLLIAEHGLVVMRDNEVIYKIPYMDLYPVPL